MAFIYGKSGHAAITRAGRKDLLLRTGLPLAFLIVLASVGAYAFLHGHYLITALFTAFFVIGLLRFNELGLTFVHHLSRAETSARSDQIVAKMLRLLPNEYHVFHDLRFYKMHIDHAVLGPNGFFLIKVNRRLGTVSLSGDSLRLNGWPFLQDLLGQSWKVVQALIKHLGLQLTAGIELTPVLCFSRGHVGFARIVRGARVVQVTSLVPAILEHEASIPSERLARLTEKLSELVWVKTETIEYTQADAGSTQHVPSAGTGPVCPKCRHQASATEMEFFPDECPRCGRLYAAGPAEPLPNNAPASRPMWRPTMPQLVMAVLAMAGTAGFLVYWTAFFSPAPSFQDTPQIHDGNTTETAERTTPPPSDAGADVPSPASEPVQDVQTESNNQTNAARSELPVLTQNPPVSLDPDPRTDSSGNATAESSIATQANATVATTALNATQANTTAAATSANATQTATRQQQPTNPAETSATGTLTIIASKPVTLWFTDQHTNNKLGPFEVGGKTTKTIVLPKGLYDVVYVENGKRKHTSISFLSDKGRLDF